MYKTNYYFEAHITIDPVLDENELERLKSLVSASGFRVAKLFMQKSLSKSNLDSFMTAKNKEYDAILDSTIKTVARLKENGYGVRRYKIENILLDRSITRES